jgi:hypothetical protein
MKKKNQKIYIHMFLKKKCGGRGGCHVASILKPIWSTTKFALAGFDRGSMARQPRILTARASGGAYGGKGTFVLKT